MRRLSDAAGLPACERRIRGGARLCQRTRIRRSVHNDCSGSDSRTARDRRAKSRSCSVPGWLPGHAADALRSVRRRDHNAQRTGDDLPQWHELFWVCGVRQHTRPVAHQPQWRADFRDLPLAAGSENIGRSADHDPEAPACRGAELGHRRCGSRAHDRTLGLRDCPAPASASNARLSHQSPFDVPGLAR